MNLDYENAKLEIVDYKILEEIKGQEHVIVFGGGQSGDWITHLLATHHIYPDCYCDNYEGKWGKYKNGLMIMSFEEAMERYPDASICIASMWAEDIEKQIAMHHPQALDRTWDLLNTMAWETTNMTHDSSEISYIRANLGQFDILYDLLEDDISKSTLEGILNYRLTRNKKYLKKIKSSQATYFDKTIVTDHIAAQIKDRLFIDGGAFDGDTVEEIIKNMDVSHNLSIHCYEAEPENCIKIKEKTKKWYPNRIYVHQAALWSSTGTELNFYGDGLSGKIAGTGENVKSVKTDCIDELHSDNVGFIKMDIEGAEREALLGARDTIRSCRPILAICAYHLQDDLLALSDFMKSMAPGYSIYLRHYMLSSGDTVMYGIPKELEEKE